MIEDDHFEKKEKSISFCQSEAVHELIKGHFILGMCLFLDLISQSHPFPNQPEVSFAVVLVEFHVDKSGQVVGLNVAFSLNVQILTIYSA